MRSRTGTSCARTVERARARARARASSGAEGEGARPRARLTLCRSWARVGTRPGCQSPRAGAELGVVGRVERMRLDRALGARRNRLLELLRQLRHQMVRVALDIAVVALTDVRARRRRGIAVEDEAQRGVEVGKDEVGPDAREHASTSMASPSRKRALASALETAGPGSSAPCGGASRRRRRREAPAVQPPARPRHRAASSMAHL